MQFKNPQLLGKHLVKLRKKAGLSQQEVEKFTGIRRETLSKYENDEQKNPTYSNLLKFARLFFPDCSDFTAMANLFGGGTDTKELQENLDLKYLENGNLKMKIMAYEEAVTQFSLNVINIRG